jgi:hypothetical protein
MSKIIYFPFAHAHFHDFQFESNQSVVVGFSSRRIRLKINRPSTPTTLTLMCVVRRSSERRWGKSALLHHLATIIELV